MLVSQRARQLVDGAQPMVPTDDVPNAVSMACREVAADKVVEVPGKHDVEIPITREEKLRRLEEEEKKRKAAEENETSTLDGVPAKAGLDGLFETIQNASDEIGDEITDDAVEYDEDSDDVVDDEE